MTVIVSILTFRVPLGLVRLPWFKQSKFLGSRQNPDLIVKLLVYDEQRSACTYSSIYYRS